jgi:pimeloyl-ACP methyl ester carboxylesterase
MNPRILLACLALALSPYVCCAQGRQAVVVFKDGFFVKGKVTEKRDFVTDPLTGVSFTIPAGNGFLYVDDVVRRIHFSPAQVQDVIDLKPDQIKEQMRLHMGGPARSGLPMLSSWTFEGQTDWDDKWQRTLQVKTKTGRLEIVQRITDVSPYFIVGLTVGYDWDFAYLTQEWGPGPTLKLVQQYLNGKSELKEHEKQLLLAKFMQQAGWNELADKQLAMVAEKYPSQQDVVKDYRAQLRKAHSDFVAEEIERRSRVGQHDLARQALKALEDDEDLFKLVSDKNRLKIQGLKSDYESSTADLDRARKYLEDFPKHAPQSEQWAAPCKALLDELSLDMVPRLKTFVGFAQQHAKELAEGKSPTQATDAVLALAVTGWLQDNTTAVPEPKTALKLYKAREFILNYLRNDSPVARGQALAAFVKQCDLPTDVLVRLIRNLPPPTPYTEKLSTTEPTKLAVELPDSDGGSYYVWLPPEYNPARSYPVVLLLQSHREKADILVKRWQEQAARNSFILAAPILSKGLKATYTYGYTNHEHSAVLDVLRDLRRKFNVDSDRVFLFGWEQGANAAFDIGLSHPDQFAGVLTVNGLAQRFPERYWSNAQYLPFYVVEGDRNGNHPKYARGVFKDWIRGHYPSLYIEYKGRASEWYAAELPNMMEWMSGKKRVHPMKEMGRYHTGGGTGEEFKTMRAGDNRFYWLSTDEVLPKHLNDYDNWVHTTQPATLQANVSVGNEPDIKAGAKIWNQFNIRATGVKQVSLWIAPDVIDFSKPVVLRVNTLQVGGFRTIQPSLQTLLEELHRSGDRQRLFIAKIDIRL